MDIVLTKAINEDLRTISFLRSSPLMTNIINILTVQIRETIRKSHRIAKIAL